MPGFSASSFFSKKTNYKNPKTYSTIELSSQSEYFESNPYTTKKQVIFHF